MSNDFTKTGVRVDASHLLNGGDSAASAQAFGTLLRVFGFALVAAAAISLFTTLAGGKYATLVDAAFNDPEQAISALLGTTTLPLVMVLAGLAIQFSGMAIRNRAGTDKSEQFVRIVQTLRAHSGGALNSVRIDEATVGEYRERPGLGVPPTGVRITADFIRGGVRTEAVLKLPYEGGIIYSEQRVV